MIIDTATYTEAYTNYAWEKNLKKIANEKYPKWKMRSTHATSKLNRIEITSYLFYEFFNFAT